LPVSREGLEQVTEIPVFCLMPEQVLLFREPGQPPLSR